MAGHRHFEALLAEEGGPYGMLRACSFLLRLEWRYRQPACRVCAGVAWQEERLARLEEAISAWDEAIDEFDQRRAEAEKEGQEISVAEAWPEFWNEFRAEHGLGAAE